MRRISVCQARRTVSWVAVVVAVISFLPQWIAEVQTVRTQGGISLCLQELPTPRQSRSGSYRGNSAFEEQRGSPEKAGRHLNGVVR